jgi:ABC-2 type transport system ATP-binding protein
VNSVAAVAISHLHHVYDTRIALDDVSFSIPAGEIFALLGPNGGGKSTLFRFSQLLFQRQAAMFALFGENILQNPQGVRTRLGVVFQYPSLDPKLTVAENLRCHGHLYGMREKFCTTE